MVQTRRGTRSTVAATFILRRLRLSGRVREVGTDFAGQRAHADLVVRLGAEFERRTAASTTPGAALSGWDDYCRVETAKVNAEHPHHTAEWVKLRVSSLNEAIDRADSLEDFGNILRDLAPSFPLAGVTSEAMAWAVHPPILVPEGEWPTLLRELPIPQNDLARLLAAGMVPIDLQNSDLPLFNGTVPPGTQLIDADYGVATIFVDGSPRTPGVDVGMLARYAERWPDILKAPQDILDVGMRRGQVLLGVTTPNQDEPITVHVRTRHDLDATLHTIRQRAEKVGLQMWLRGQPRQYLMPDVRDLALRGLCPVRSALDASQVPSMYRGVNRRLDDPHTYCRWVVQLLTYYLFLRETLALPTAVARPHPDEEPEELLKGAWAWGVPELSVTRQIDGELYELADTHFAHGQVQAALFLQHYGIESNILDLTYDTEVALFFAQNRIKDGRYVAVTDGFPVIYVFLLDPELDRVASTPDLLNGLEVIRPLRQRCGVLGGASLISRNFYARFIAVRLVLEAHFETGDISAEYLFPAPSEDRILHNLQVVREDLGLKLAGPFALQSN
jgi:FRG domain